MDREAIIARLKANEAALRAQGVRHAGLSGSRARGDHRADSDIDILIEVAPEAGVGLWEYEGNKVFIRQLFDVSVEVVDRDHLKPLVRPSAERDAVYAF